MTEAKQILRALILSPLVPIITFCGVVAAVVIYFTWDDNRPMWAKKMGGM